jgi:hypothetical protein
VWFDSTRPLLIAFPPPRELSCRLAQTGLAFVVSDSPLSQLLSPRLRTSPPSACALPHTTPSLSSLPAPPSLHLGFFGSVQSPVFGLSTLEQPSVCRPLFTVKVVSQHRPLNTCATWAFSGDAHSFDLSSPPHPRSLSSPLCSLPTLARAFRLHPPIVTHHRQVCRSIA